MVKFLYPDEKAICSLMLWFQKDCVLLQDVGQAVLTATSSSDTIFTEAL
jgi:hypothetical protein